MGIMSEDLSEVAHCTAVKKTLWYRYRSFIQCRTIGSIKNEEDITYWRDKLFTDFITYLLPTCFIALVPCVIISFKQGYNFIGVFDILVLFSIAFVSLNPRLGLTFRKIFVIGILYVLAVILLVALSLAGPGTIYLLALSIFVTVFFPRYYAYSSIVLSFLICCGCAFIIEFDLFHSPLAKDYVLGVWIAVSSNVVFLNWVIVMLISNAIEGLEQTLMKEYLLKNALQKEATEKAEQTIQLKESEYQYRSLFFLNPAPMWVLDIESLRLLQVNEAAIRTYGYSNEEFLTLTIMDIKLEGDLPSLQSDIQTAIEMEGPLTVITRHRRKNKEQFHVEVIFNTILFRGKNATLVIARDISQQVDHANAVKQKNDKLREIAYIQSHLVRAPLARILGLINLINEDISERTDPELLLYLNESATELDEMIRAINKKTEASE